jgi:Na+/melibiose symporter-like transporter
MFSDLKERATVSIDRQIGAVLWLLSQRYGTFRGWSLTAAGLAVVAWAGFWVLLLGSRERREYMQEGSLPILAAFKATFTNRSFLSIAPAMLAINFIWGWLSTMAACFNKYVLGAAEAQMSVLFLAMFGTSAVFYPAWRWITLRTSS